jgi:aldehyde dehydrogenase (NAD+)
MSTWEQFDIERIKRGPFLIDGQWLSPAGRRAFEIVTPFDESIYSSVSCANAEDIGAAVTAARKAFDRGPWLQLSHRERAEYLERIASGLETHASTLGALYTHEVGALGAQAGGLISASVGIFRQYARLGREFQSVERHATTAGGNVGLLVHEPVGVVAAIIPWNGPIIMLAAKLAPALLAGCTVIVKTSPEAPLEALLVGAIIEAAGVPAGVVNILMADREESELLVRHEGVDKVSFTGSSVVGRQVAAICGARMARATLELGGKSAALVLQDAELDTVVEAIVPQLSAMAMQFCSALSRVIVPRSRHDELLERLASALAALRIGNPLDPSTQMGPLAMRRQLDRVKKFIASGRKDGFTLATGGHRPTSLGRGFYIEPTVFGNVDNHSSIAREEIFGPVIAVIPARDDDEAVTLANDTLFGLNNSVFTPDADRAMQVARRLRSGTVGHNAFRSDFGIAFGGFKQSGIGREGGLAGLAPYLEAKTIVLEAEPNLNARQALSEKR